MAAPTNALSRLRERLRAEGARVIDLSAGNPTQCGLLVEPQQLLPLADAVGVHYRPCSFGSRQARQAVARYYQRRGMQLDWTAVMLSASTSELYSYLFKLLCDPCDEVLVPQPSYPLFPYLARLEGVGAVPYPAIKQEGYRIDLDAVERLLRLRPRVRAMIVVHPNNPTGAMLHQADAAALVQLLARHDVALIVDEVFVDYVWRPPRESGRRASFAGESGCMCFVMSGLSKVALLPQVKLAWLVTSGPSQLVEQARRRLEVIADCYLSLSTAVQLAAPGWLDHVDARQQRLRQRLASNLRSLDAAIARVGPACPVRRATADGGWYVLVEVPRTRNDEAWALHLLRQQRLAVQPGYFYDMDEAGVMVVSLLLPPDVFDDAVVRAVRCWSEG